MSITELQNQQAAHFAVVHTLYLVLFGAATWVWLRHGGVEMSALVTAVCFAPAALGLGLTFTSTADFEQYTLRIVACALFTPILLLFWGGSVDAASPASPRLVWPFATGASIFHALAFAGTVMWVGTASTQVPAQPNTVAVSAETLLARLRSLSEISGPFDITSPAPHELVIWYRYPTGDERSLAVLLNLDGEKHQVRVRERESFQGARPKDSAEASMRALGDPVLDPTRPEASRVYGTVAQTRPIKLVSLTANPAILHERSVAVPAGFGAALDETGMVTLLCAVVTRSGWDWQPAFFGAK